jgi:predicted MPP superfamily phosphohydrolase
MNLGKLIGGTILAGAGLLVYGAVVEVDKLRVEQRRLRLRGWPRNLNGFRIGFLSDFHLRDRQTIELGKRAIQAVIDAAPDIVLLGGDFVHRWDSGSQDALNEVFGPLSVMDGKVIAVPGNRDYLDGFPELLLPAFEAAGITMLRNESLTMGSVTYAGIDSANAGQADPIEVFEDIDDTHPIITLWHEPDMVDWLPAGSSLMLSGHSHGGQFTTPWGWAPVTSKNGKRYLRGFYPHASTPLYVSRGLGTTGPPSRLFCTPEATVIDVFAV